LPFLAAFLLTLIVIPESITAIGHFAFSGCTALTTIDCVCDDGCVRQYFLVYLFVQDQCMFAQTKLCKVVLSYGKKLAKHPPNQVRELFGRTAPAFFLPRPSMMDNHPNFSAT
jgi:hypothetical protein